MERQVVCIVLVVSPAQTVIKCGSCDGYDIPSFKEPINVLEACLLDIGIVKDHIPNGPLLQVG